jgi:hypothetical protein
VSARFFAAGLAVYDRKTEGTVCVGCRSRAWAEMIADGLNIIVDQVAPWSPGAAHSPVVDGEVIEFQDQNQKAIGWHDEPLSSL